MKEPSNTQQIIICKKGLTLIEMIIAIAILGMIALVFTPRFIESTKMMEHSRRNNISANLANSEMEYLRSLDFEEIIELAGGNPLFKEITVDNHVYNIETIFVEYKHDGLDGFMVKVLVQTERVIHYEPIQQSIQSYISR